jgi:hypothetical protein
MKPSVLKWFVLLTLLAVTVWLTLTAPQEQTQQGVVKPIQPNSTNTVTAIKTTPSETMTLLTKRKRVEEVVDIFAPPVKTIQPVVIPPIKMVKPVKPAVSLPFRYIGQLQEESSILFFFMEGQTLHLIKTGDVINNLFRLDTFDAESKVLTWRHLPTNEIHKMSIQR